MEQTTYEQHLRRELLTADEPEAKGIKMKLRTIELGANLSSSALKSKCKAVEGWIHELIEGYDVLINPYIMTWDEEGEADEHGEFVAETASAYYDMKSEWECFAREMDALLLEHSACEQALSDKRVIKKEVAHA
jgi:hypothetical protein